MSKQTKTYTKGIPMPIMIPLPIPIPKKVNWWNLWGHIKNIGVRAQPRKWRIEKDYILYIPWLKRYVCVPKGFVFDGASVPRIFWPIMSPTGLMLIAGLFHDVGYRYDCWFDVKHNPIYVGFGKTFFDGQIKEMGEWINDTVIIPYICWAGLFIGGCFTWTTRRKENRIASDDFPAQS
ncbi:MAG: DUF1353 domain-containing protein [Candidatus Peribacteraceae bacterium]|nr:DUF1353 domain-containing protein [Candidatus Peribacteraceae bacterium]